ncbi:carboxypeptidase SOL1-like isoform X1 [Chenopodium quinoa]|uniref:carboxypeptidase SOL1-like isoform X1 n=2 Tax=Chenopodium quinoa TaxID=63459 RepID=UPI000B781640|nr:carboxypeptidase SOL1-like isoform X1 [Chenopodium quinoa]
MNSLSLYLLSFITITLTFFCFIDLAFALTSEIPGRRLLDDESSKPRIDVTKGYMSNEDLENAIMAFGERCSNISRIYSIGRSVNGFPLWVMEISDKPESEEPEPAFKFIGNVHGDEPVGRELLIRLANWLCDNHVKDPLATFIVKNVHLHILPSMNPDGYALRKRGNAKNIDLNRDFPDQFFAINDLEDARQPETKAIMRWLRRIQFTASASLHGGALVANYPWDGTQDKRKEYYATPDDETFQLLASLYSQSHYNMSTSKEFPGGITNGAAWYPIYGGMQDWNYIHAGCFELTLEISDNKWPNASELPTIWEYNKMSMLNLVAATVKTGVHGRIFSSDTGRPLPASINIKGFNQTVKAGRLFADYHRLLVPGIKYQVTASSPGYKSKSTTIFLEEGATTADFVLEPEISSVGKIVETGCPCSGSNKNRLEVVDILAHPQMEISLVIVVAFAFLLLLYRRKLCFSLPKHRQSAGSKRPVVV